MDSPDILIVGAGPAGSALALFLAREAPDLARRTLILEKRRHPRHKVCAGGLIPHSLDCLRELGIELSVPHCLVHRAAVRIPGREVHYGDRDLCAVVRRDQFDALLAERARQGGAALREDEKVLEVRREPQGFRVQTERREIRPRVIVGADGSGSIVRRELFPDGRNAVGRAVMCDLRADEIAGGFDPERYVFDFLAVPRGLRGYLWEFPCLIDGKPHVNLGAYALDRGGKVSLPALVTERARELGVASPRLEAFPIRWYTPGSPIALPGALLAGDAAGADPLMGEGISYAFEYARLAARHVAAAFASGDFGFASYTDAVDRSWFGRKLRRLGTATRVFYGRASRLSLALAARSRRLQHIGIRWYNGIDGWDRASDWRVALRLLTEAGRGGEA